MAFTLAKKDISNRVHLIDEVRGFAIICMVVYHMFFDIVDIFGADIPFFHSDLMDFIVIVFVFAFVFISGSACLYSHNNLKRGAICFGLGMALTAITYFFMPQELILFGILHMLGVSMMLYALLEKLLNKVKTLWLFIGSFIIFLLTFSVNLRYIGIFGIKFFSLPTFLYDLKFLFPFGFTGNNFFSADYFALFPWFFAFLCGVAFGRILKENKAPKSFYKSHIKPLAFVGRHTLLIYVLHQPIIFAVLTGVFSLIK